MSKYIKIALGLIAAGVVLAAIGNFLGGSGFFITNGFNTYSKQDMQLFEYQNMEIENLDSIDISVSNVPVTFRAAKGEKYGVEIKYQVVDLEDVTVSVEDGELEVKAEHEDYWWSYDFSFFESNDVEEYVIVHIPEFSSMEDVVVSTSNASVVMDNVGCKIKELDIDTSNAAVTLSGAYILDSLVIDTSNGEIRLDDSCVCGSTAKLITSNASVTLLDAEVDFADIQTSNGEIVLDIAAMFEEKHVKADTSNAGIYVTLQQERENETDIKADTSNGNIYINGVNTDDDEYSSSVNKGAKLELDASNSDIKIEFGLK